MSQVMRRTRVPRIAGTALLVLALCSAPGVSVRAQQNDADPKPYQPEEFPQRAHTFRRAEIVAIGSFPLTLVLQRGLFEYLRFTVSGFQPYLRPWPFRGGVSAVFSVQDQRGILAGAVLWSIGIAIADYAIRANAPPRPEIVVPLPPPPPVAGESDSANRAPDP